MIPADILIVYLVALALSIAVLTFFKTRRSRMYLPPGYYPWPLLGNLPKLFRQEPHLFVTEVGEYFGGVITFYKGSTPIVMFNRLDQAVEAFVNQSAVFSDRSIPPLWERSFTSKGSVLWENGSVWRFHRRSIHSGIRHIENTDDNLSSKVISETEKLFRKIDRELGKPINVAEHLRALSSRLVCSVVFGRRFSSFEESDSFDAFLAGVKCISTQLSTFSLAFVFPPLFDTFLYDEIRTSIKYVRTFLRDMFIEHKKSFREGVISDVTDAYCDVLRKEGDKRDIGESEISDTFFDLLGAGTDTTANTLLWGLMYMCGYQDYQDRIAEELANVCAASDMVTADKRDRSPLTYATILEVMRCATVVPLGLPHVTARDARVCGYDIPKGTEVSINQYAIHNDENLWKEPEKFLPERFLNGDRILTEKKNQLVAFGLGRRICIGKKLAETELFVVFSNLFKRYRVRFADPHQKVDKVGIFGLTYFPKPFEVVFEERRSELKV